MIRILAAALASGCVGAAAWLAITMLGRAFFSAVRGPELLAGGLLGMAVLGIAFVAIPLFGGFAGGLVSRRYLGLVGSIAGSTAATLGVPVLLSGSGPSLEGIAVSIILTTFLTAAGHLTGMAVRQPERRPT